LVPLAKAKLKLYTLKTHLSQLKCGITVTTRTTKYEVTVECPPDIKTTQKQLSKIQKEIKTIIRNSRDKRVEYNKIIASINAITGKATKEKALKAIVNAEEMSKVWTKIGHANKKYKSGSIASLQIPVTWLSSDCDENQIRSLDNPKEVQHWRTVETPREIAFI
jgi:phosphopantetheine adenylyltransferase